MMFFFFFSSRRRHTRYWRDWSSDVCSSDLDASHNFNNESKYQNTLNILGEIDKEFVCEGKRWYALLRMKDQSGKALVFNADVNYPFIVGAAKAPILKESEAYKTLWPISVSTYSNDTSIEQNPGYQKFN